MTNKITMIKQIANSNLLVLLFFFMFLSQGTAIANISRKPLALPLVIKQAQNVVVVQLSSFDTQDVPNLSNKNNFGPFTQTPPFKEKGSYNFKVVRNIKGNCDPEILLHLPALMSRHYGYNSFQVEVGLFYVLFLKTDKNGRLSILEPLTPLLPIEAESLKISTLKNKEAQDDVVFLLLNSLKEINHRLISTYFLKSVRGENVVKYLTPYVSDDNREVRDNVLYCMIFNQRVEFIPNLIQFASTFSSDESPDALIALQDLRTPAATPYLNSLILRREYYVRLNAVIGLSNVANETSVPYLFLATFEEDPQQVIPWFAYVTLKNLVNGLNDVEHSDDFYKRRDIIRNDLVKWWGSYLKKKTTTDTLSSNRFDVADKLFVGSIKDRIELLDAIGIKESDSVIPFLILSLLDPNKRLASTADGRLFKSGFTSKSGDDLVILFDKSIVKWRDSLNIDFN